MILRICLIPKISLFSYQYFDTENTHKITSYANHWINLNYLKGGAKLYIYIYIVIHRQSVLLYHNFSMCLDTGRIKMESKPAQLYIRLSIWLLNHQATYVSSWITTYYVLTFVSLHFALPDTSVLNSLEELYITCVAAVNSLTRVLNPWEGSVTVKNKLSNFKQIQTKILKLLKVNVIMQMTFGKNTGLWFWSKQYFKTTVQYFRHYATGTAPINFLFRIKDKLHRARFYENGWLSHLHNSVSSNKFCSKRLALYFFFFFFFISAGSTRHQNSSLKNA